MHYNDHFLFVAVTVLSATASSESNSHGISQYRDPEAKRMSSKIDLNQIIDVIRIKVLR